MGNLTIQTTNKGSTNISHNRPLTTFHKKKRKNGKTNTHTQNLRENKKVERVQKYRKSKEEE